MKNLFHADQILIILPFLYLSACGVSTGSSSQGQNPGSSLVGAVNPHSAEIEIQKICTLLKQNNLVDSGGFFEFEVYRNNISSPASSYTSLSNYSNRTASMRGNCASGSVSLSLNGTISTGGRDGSSSDDKQKSFQHFFADDLNSVRRSLNDRTEKSTSGGYQALSASGITSNLHVESGYSSFSFTYDLDTTEAYYFRSAYGNITQNTQHYNLHIKANLVLPKTTSSHDGRLNMSYQSDTTYPNNELSEYYDFQPYQ